MSLEAFGLTVKKKEPIKADLAGAGVAFYEAAIKPSAFSVAPQVEPAPAAPDARVLTIPRDVAVAAFNWTSMDPDKRGEAVMRDFIAEQLQVREMMEKKADTPAKKALLEGELSRFNAGYREKYMAWLHSHANCASTMVTGGSGFDVRRADKANEREHNKLTEVIEFKKRAIAAIEKKLKEAGIEEAGGPIEVMKAQLVKAMQRQESMKQANMIIRKKVSDDEKVRTLMAVQGMSEALARELLKPDFAGRAGFPQYELTNNNANIKRMQDRIKEMERREATPTTETPFEGGMLVDSQEEDRIQLMFDGKPPERIISVLGQEVQEEGGVRGAFSVDDKPTAGRFCKFITDCVHSTGPKIDAMMNQAKRINNAKFRKAIGPHEYAIIESSLGYGTALRLERDYHVEYYESFYEGRPVVVMVHSAIEYIWGEP